MCLFCAECREGGKLDAVSLPRAILPRRYSHRVKRKDRERMRDGERVRERERRNNVADLSYSFEVVPTANLNYKPCVVSTLQIFGGNYPQKYHPLSRENGLKF